MCETFFDGFDNITNKLRHQASCGIKGSQYSPIAFFSQRKMLISYPVSIYKRKRGKKQKKIVSVSRGHPKWAIFFYTCALTIRKMRTSHQWLFSLCHSDLPWEISRTPLWRQLLRSIEITLLLKVPVRVVGCAGWSSRLHTAFSLISGFSLWMRNSEATV